MSSVVLFKGVAVKVEGLKMSLSDCLVGTTSLMNSEQSGSIAPVGKT